MPVKHAPDTSAKLGFACICGVRLLTEKMRDEHVIEANNEEAFDQTIAEAKSEPINEETEVSEEADKNEVQAEEVVEDKAPAATPEPEPKSTTPKTAAKPASVAPSQETKAVVPAAPAPAALTPIQKVQSDVVRYVTNILDKDRAKEFATRVALIARENPKINEVITKNPDSFLTAYMASATLGLMPNTPEQQAYIIPYGNMVQFQPGYRGLIALARRSGEIKTISAELVFDGDEFDIIYGTDRKIVHRPSFNVNRTDYSKVTGAYAAALLTNGESQFTYMTRDELDKIQKSVKASGPGTPWRDWPERMALKTVLKRLAVLLPMSTDDALRKAVAYDNLSEAGKLKFDRDSGDILEGELVEVPSNAVDAIRNATTKEELQAVLNELPTEERKKAATLVTARLKEL